MRTSSIPWVKDFLKRLPKEERKEVLYNLSKARKGVKDHNFNNPNVEHLRQTFLWDESPQGFKYWADLYERAYGG